MNLNVADEYISTETALRPIIVAHFVLCVVLVEFLLPVGIEDSLDVSLTVGFIVGCLTLAMGVVAFTALDKISALWGKDFMNVWASVLFAGWGYLMALLAKNLFAIVFSGYDKALLASLLVVMPLAIMSIGASGLLTYHVIPLYKFRIKYILSH